LDGEAQLDTSIAPTATLGNPSHSDQHENVNGAVQALEAKLGIGSSAAASSTDQMVLVSSGSTTSWGHRGVAVFADSTARDAAISSPVDGVVAYTQDSNQLWVHNGSSWVEVIDLDVFKQYVTATSSARPAASEGRLIWETDTDRLMVYDGAEWTPPTNTAWGVDGSVTHSVGFHSLATSAATAIFAVTLRSDRKYQVSASMSTLANDTTGTGGATRFLMTATYDGTYANRVSYWQADANDAASGSNVCVTFIVTGTGSSANLSFSVADQLGRGYDQQFRGYNVGDYCTLVITDIGPA
jgi:hypothetical protein